MFINIIYIYIYKNKIYYKHVYIYEIYYIYKIYYKHVYIYEIYYIYKIYYKQVYKDSPLSYITICVYNTKKSNFISLFFLFFYSLFFFYLFYFYFTFFYTSDETFRSPLSPALSPSLLLLFLKQKNGRKN